MRRIEPRSATEVFFFPAAAHTEKDGTFTNTQRLLQWHHKAVEPKGETRSELRFSLPLGTAAEETVRERVSINERNWPIRDLIWDYPAQGPLNEPKAEAVLKEINGYTIADGKPVEGFTSSQRRWIDGMWLLDLFRRLSATAINHDSRGASRTGSRITIALRMGVGMAAQSADHLQSRLCRS